MEVGVRNNKKRSVTEIQTLGKSSSGGIKVRFRRGSIKAKEEKIPIYTPGPRPSPLLLSYLNSLPEKEEPRIVQIKKYLHRHTGSYHALGRKV